MPTLQVMTYWCKCGFCCGPAYRPRLERRVTQQGTRLCRCVFEGRFMEKDRGFVQPAFCPTRLRFAMEANAGKSITNNSTGLQFTPEFKHRRLLMKFLKPTASFTICCASQFGESKGYISTLTYTELLHETMLFNFPAGSWRWPRYLSAAELVATGLTSPRWTSTELGAIQKA